MNDDLDSKTDAELNELFAVEVAEIFKIVPITSFHKRKGIAALFRGDVIKREGSQPYTPEAIRWKDGKYGGDKIPDFCADATAVIPQLNRGRWNSYFEGEAIHRVTVERGLIGEWDGNAPTFERAAVIALLRAKRATA